MHELHWHYYNGLRDDVTNAEVQQACEAVAGTSLVNVFEYVYTTKELDCSMYLGYAGLTPVLETDPKTGDGNSPFVNLKM